MKKIKTSNRKKKFVGILSNHTDRRDDETLTVWAKDSTEAETLIKQKMDTTRFSLRTVLTAKEARSNWA